MSGFVILKEFNELSFAIGMSLNISLNLGWPDLGSNPGIAVVRPNQSEHNFLGFNCQVGFEFMTVGFSIVDRNSSQSKCNLLIGIREILRLR